MIAGCLSRIKLDTVAGITDTLRAEAREVAYADMRARIASVVLHELSTQARRPNGCIHAMLDWLERCNHQPRARGPYANCMLGESSICEDRRQWEPSMVDNCTIISSITSYDNDQKQVYDQQFPVLENPNAQVDPSSLESTIRIKYKHHGPGLHLFIPIQVIKAKNTSHQRRYVTGLHLPPRSTATIERREGKKDEKYKVTALPKFLVIMQE